VNPTELLRALRRGDQATGADRRVESGYRLNEALTSSRSDAVLNATRLGDTIRLVAERPG
jgi:hypothetical protein